MCYLIVVEMEISYVLFLVMTICRFVVSDNDLMFLEVTVSERTSRCRYESIDLFTLIN